MPKGKKKHEGFILIDTNKNATCGHSLTHLPFVLSWSSISTGGYLMKSLAPGSLPLRTFHHSHHQIGWIVLLISPSLKYSGFKSIHLNNKFGVPKKDCLRYHCSALTRQTFLLIKKVYAGITSTN